MSDEKLDGPYIGDKRVADMVSGAPRLTKADMEKSEAQVFELAVEIRMYWAVQAIVMGMVVACVVGWGAELDSTRLRVAWDILVATVSFAAGATYVSGKLGL